MFKIIIIIILVFVALDILWEKFGDKIEDKIEEFADGESGLSRKEKALHNIDSVPQKTIEALCNFYEKNYTINGVSIQSLARDDEGDLETFCSGRLAKEYVTNSLKFEKTMLNKALVVYEKISNKKKINDKIVLVFGDGTREGTDNNAIAYHSLEIEMSPFDNKEYEDLLVDLDKDEYVFVICILRSYEQGTFKACNGALFGTRNKTLEWAQNVAISYYNHQEEKDE